MRSDDGKLFTKSLFPELRKDNSQYRIHPPFEAKYTQFSTQKASHGSTTNFAKQSKREQEANIHKAMYEAWKNYLHILKPEQQFITTINCDGDLMFNNQCICKNWKHKVGLA